MISAIIRTAFCAAAIASTVAADKLPDHSFEPPFAEVDNAGLRYQWIVLQINGIFNQVYFRLVHKQWKTSGSAVVNANFARLTPDRQVRLIQRLTAFFRLQSDITFWYIEQKRCSLVKESSWGWHILCNSQVSYFRTRKKFLWWWNRVMDFPKFLLEGRRSTWNKWKICGRWNYLWHF